ncbi:MAG: ribonuclease III [Deltaproteobacteria bacterium]
MSQEFSTLESRLGHKFRDQALLARALVHCSAGSEEGIADNETLEFLGDAVVGLATSNLLMSLFPELDEGDLSRRRAALVNGRQLASLGQDLGLGAWLKLGKGEEKSGGREKQSILAAVYEAVLGAIFLDAGFDTAQAAVKSHFGPRLEAAETLSEDPKSHLQELAQGLGTSLPVYATTAVSGPDHARHYEVKVSLEGRVLGQGQGPSLKVAEREAASRAIGRLAGG